MDVTKAVLLVDSMVALWVVEMDALMAALTAAHSVDYLVAGTAVLMDALSAVGTVAH